MFNLMRSMHDDTFNHFFNDGMSNIENAENAKKIYLDIPGVKKEDLLVRVDNNILLLEAERKGFIKSKYKKSYSLSNDFDTDNIVAELIDGVLTITLPYKDKKAVKSITIK